MPIRCGCGCGHIIGRSRNDEYVLDVLHRTNAMEKENKAAYANRDARSPRLRDRAELRRAVCDIVAVHDGMPPGLNRGDVVSRILDAVETAIDE